jgi:hypothetical protein
MPAVMTCHACLDWLFPCSGEEPGHLDACIFVLGGRSSGFATCLCQALPCIQNPTGDPSLLGVSPYCHCIAGHEGSLPHLDA